MNTIFKNRFFAIASLFAMIFAGSSCEDNIVSQATPEAPNGDKTLYEVIVNDSELTHFVEVLDACNIPSLKNNAEIVSVADSLFNTSKVYTVWAPINGSFDKDSVLQRIADGYRDDVMKSFVGSHVANFMRPAQGTFDKDGEFVLMLNDKKMLFAGSYKDYYTFGGNRLCSVNDRAKNGILHKIEKTAEYKYNIWEYLRVYSQISEQYKVDSLVNYLYSYNDTVFSAWSSIPGPIVNGEETYLDSVFIFENNLLRANRGVGELNNEDSLFIFYLPTNEAWNNVIAKASKHFNYDKNYALKNEIDTALVDSLELYYPRYNFIKYLTYSMNEQKYVEAEDSLMPIQSEYPRPLFARSDLDRYVVETKELSNGTLKVLSDFPYTIFDLWHDTIRIEGEHTHLINKDLTDKEGLALMKTYTVYDKDINKKAGKKLSGSQYAVFGFEDNSKTELSYYISGVKSATYQVALILVPENINNSKMNVDSLMEEGSLLQVNLDCSIKSFIPSENKIGNLINKVKDLQPKMDRIDTLYLPELVTFPVCEYEFTSDVKKNSALITIAGDNSKKKAGNKIRLDAILLIPVEDPVEDAE